MKIPFDISDVPMVAGPQMEQAIDLIVMSGNTRVLFDGHTPQTRERFEDRFWQSFKGSTAEGVAVLVRLWSLVDVLQSRRLSQMVLTHGFSILRPLARAAAGLRLNAEWGFAPQKVIWSVTSQNALAQPSRISVLKAPVTRRSTSPTGLELAA
ncbi:MAG: hypothetical protein AAFV69_05395 [Pseudomonadota bacterium]